MSKQTIPEINFDPKRGGSGLCTSVFWGNEDFLAALRLVARVGRTERLSRLDIRPHGIQVFIESTGPPAPQRPRGEEGGL